MAYVNFGRKATRREALASTNKDKIFFPTDDDTIVLGGREFGMCRDVKSLVSSTIIPKPISPVQIYITSGFPSSKGDVKSGTIKFVFDDRVIECNVEIDLQGQSSLNYAKKNISIKLPVNSPLTIGNLVTTNEFVWKANYIDRTQCRNLTSNRLWGEITAGRNTVDKKKGYIDGFPSVLYLNGHFYGIGNLNIGKSMSNYQSAGIVQAADHIDFSRKDASSFKMVDNFVNNLIIENFYTYFGDECLNVNGSKEVVKNYVDIKNFIDYYLFLEFAYADDDVDKNFIIGFNDDMKLVFYPYDLDSTFGLWWDGTNASFKSGSVLKSSNVKGVYASAVWGRFRSYFIDEIKERYAELRNNGVFTSSKVYNIASELFFAFTEEQRMEEEIAWNRSGIAEGDTVGFFAEWVEDRIKTLDAMFGYNEGGESGTDDRIGDMNDLETLDKASLVAAINELAKRVKVLEGGGSESGDVSVVYNESDKSIIFNSGATYDEEKKSIVLNGGAYEATNKSINL